MGEKALIKRLEAAERALANKNRAMGVLAHDLRPLVRSLLMSLEQLDLELDYEDFAQLKRAATGQGATIIHLLDKLLYTAKIHSGTITVNATPFTVQDAVKSITDSYQRTAAKKSVKIIAKLPDKPLRVTLDPHRFREIIANVVDNAVKYSKPGGVISISVREDEKRFQVLVVDNGIGIRSDEMPLIFDPFNSLSNQPTGGESSSGLGLSIVKKLIELFGGTIRVKSKIGVGTQVVVSLPNSIRSTSKMFAENQT